MDLNPSLNCFVGVFWGVLLIPTTSSLSSPIFWTFTLLEVDNGAPDPVNLAISINKTTSLAQEVRGSREDAAVAALQIRGTSGNPFFQLSSHELFSDFLAKKTLKISNTIQSLHISNRRDKSRIKYDVMKETSLCIRGKPLLHEYFLYPMTGKSQYLPSGLPWIKSFLGNSKCDHTWEQPGKKKPKSHLWSSSSVSLHILKNNRGKRSELFPTFPISLGKQELYKHLSSLFLISETLLATCTDLKPPAQIWNTLWIYVCAHHPCSTCFKWPSMALLPVDTNWNIRQ